VEREKQGESEIMRSRRESERDKERGEGRLREAGERTH